MSLRDIFSIIFQDSWESEEVPVNWMLANVVVFKKGKKEDPVNYRLIGLTLVPGNIMEIIQIKFEIKSADIRTDHRFI